MSKEVIAAMKNLGDKIDSLANSVNDLTVVLANDLADDGLIESFECVLHGDDRDKSNDN